MVYPRFPIMAFVTAVSFTVDPRALPTELRYGPT